MSLAVPAGAQEVTLYIGGIYATAAPTLVTTLLGSCVAVCLHDRTSRVGGMNHFMLPGDGSAGDEPTRFGVHAMDCLIGAMLKEGADRRRLVAKVFGGASVLRLGGPSGGVPARNVKFAQEFLEREGFPVLASDVGGAWPRQVHFHTGSGQAFVKRITRVPARARLASLERQHLTAPVRHGDVTLFERCP